MSTLKTTPLNIVVTLRKTASEIAYENAKYTGTLKPLSQEVAIRTYTYWKLIKNRFPYDAVFKQHDMLIPKRTFEHRKSMSLAEQSELMNIIEILEGDYDVMFENMPSKKSIKTLFHIHLAVYVDNRKDMSL